MKSTKAKDQFIDPEDWQKFAEYLRETNRFILSDYWENFIKLIVKTSHKRIKLLKKGTKLVRARIGASWIKFDNGDDNPVLFLHMKWDLLKNIFRKRDV